MTTLDLVVVVSERNRGWILDTIAKEIVARYPGRAAVRYRLTLLPRARAYLFTHYSLYGAALRRDPRFRWRQTFVFFTHPNYSASDAASVVRRLRTATGIVSMSTVHAQALIASGLPEHQVSVQIPGVDPGRFHPDSTRGRLVGFCGAYYERKDPERIAAVVRAMPQRQFVLLGRRWRDWAGMTALCACPNFTYAEPDYDEYPEWYRRMDIFISPGRLEGGPIPLLEAMMSNVVPVASRTGFAPDLIDPGRNGFLFDVDAPVDEVVELVNEAGAISADVRATVVGRTWDAFVTGLHRVVQGLP